MGADRPSAAKLCGDAKLRRLVVDAFDLGGEAAPQANALQAPTMQGNLGATVAGLDHGRFATFDLDRLRARELCGDER